MNKITIVYLLASFTIIYITISGYKNGPGTNGYDCTGAETGLGNPKGCGTNCHGTTATTGISVTIELDSAGGVPTTHYTGGKKYTVKLSGKNNTANILPKFGLQLGAIKGAVALTTPVNAGTWNTPWPASTHFATPQAGNFVVGVCEHTGAITATTGTGGNGTTYVASFSWTAPTSGTGTISIWGAINAVDFDGKETSSDKWNTNNIVIAEWTATEVTSLSENAEVKAFPNPVSDNLNLQLNNLQEGIYSLSVFDISGKKISVQKIDVVESSRTENISAINWPQGIYHILIEKGDFRKHISVVKK